MERGRLCRAQACCHVGSLAKGLAQILQGKHQQEMVVLLLAQEQSTRPSCSPSSAVPPPPPLLWGGKSFNME